MTEINSIKILAFGKVKDITGWSESSIENAQSLNQIRNQLYLEFPKLESIKSIQWAVNEEYTNDYTKMVFPGDVIALIPPVSGG